jgi:hypothetical protein
MAARKKAKASKKAVKRGKAKKAPAKKKTPAKRKAAKAPAGRTRAGKAKPARKAAAPARKKAPAKKKAPVRKKKQVVGEGDYEGSRAFLKDQAGFVQANKDKIPEMGRQARDALEGSEGPSLMAAEAEAKSHAQGDAAEDE